MGIEAVGAGLMDAFAGDAAATAIGDVAAGGLMDAGIGAAADVSLGGALDASIGAVGLDAAGAGAAAGAGGISDAAFSEMSKDVAEQVATSSGWSASDIAAGFKSVGGVVTSLSDLAKGVTGLIGTNSLANPSMVAAPTLPKTPAATAAPIAGVPANSLPGANSNPTGQNKTYDQIAAMADPFTQQRKTYGDMLDKLMKDPSGELGKLPGYQAGLDAVQRSMGAQGYGGSGNMATSLLQYGGNIFDQEVGRLTALADANPGNAVAAAGDVSNMQQFDVNRADQNALQLAHMNLATQEFNATSAQQLSEYNSKLASTESSDQAHLSLTAGLANSGAKNVGTVNAVNLAGQSLNSLASGVSGIFGSSAASGGGGGGGGGVF